MATLKDISEELGLSVATVSRALNGFPEVSEKTRELVEQTAQRMNYRPNRAAQKLVSGRSGMVGMLVPLQPGMSAESSLVEVIMGLSTLLLFVALESAIGWPAGRGLLTITLAHITFSMAFVTLVVQSRLAGQDHALEDAAMDLGASPLVAFLTVTLPLLAPAVIAGWLLAFTLSLDDLVIASFVSGPGATTLPMLIYSRVRLGLSPEVNALAAVVIGLAMSVIGLAGWLLSRSPGQERGRD